MIEITQENHLIDIPDLNRFRIGDHVIFDASADNDRFEGVVIGIELQRLHGSKYLVPSITLLHDGCTTDGFKPSDCRKVYAPPPQPNLAVLRVELESAASLLETLAEDLPEDDVSAIMMSVMAKRNRAALATTEGSEG